MIMPGRNGAVAAAALFALVYCASVASQDLQVSLLHPASQLSTWLSSTRQHLHQIPELGFALHNTSALVRAHLDDLGIPYRYPVATSGIVATLGSGSPVVVLRADMDALPVEEPLGLSFRSKNEGVMHACGHDVHMTMLLGAARLLKQREAQLKGTVRLVFQPAEECCAGGDIMIKEGVLEGAAVAFGMHVMPTLPTGYVSSRAGTIMAGALSFTVTVTGTGGHAAIPHLNVDPIVAAAALVGSLQTLVSRETSPLDSAVLSVTMLHAGYAFNVIPDQAEISGTIRALTHEKLEHLQERIESMSRSVAAAYGCSTDVDWRLDEQPYYPPTVNNAATFEYARGVTQRLLGADKFVVAEPLLAGEDFSFFCRAVPSAFLFVGIRNETLGSVHNLHSNQFLVDEGALHVGAALHAALAIDYLELYGGSGAAKDEL